MLRRSVLEISRRRGIRRLPRQITAQTRPFLSSRNDFSTAAKVPEPTEKPSGSGSSAGKIIFGSAIIGAAGAAVYQYGYLDQFLGKSEHGSLEADDDNVPQDIREPVVLPKVEEPIASRGDAKEVVEKVDPRTVTSSSQELSEKLEKPNESPEIIPAVDVLIANVVDKTSVTLTTDKLAIESETDTKSSENGDSSESTALTTQQAEPENKDTLTTDKLAIESETDTKSSENGDSSESTALTTQQAEPENKDDTRALPPPNIVTDYTPEDTPMENVEAVPLLDAYNLREKSEEGIASLSREELSVSIDKAKGKEDLSDAYVSEDGKLVLDFLQAIHAAEKRQAELDAHVFAEEKRMLKEKYEKELKDARARELMYAEEAAILEKELNKERAKAVAALKSLQETAEEKLKMEIKQKEKEADLEIKKIQELAKAELAAAIANEKAAQIEKMAEANLHINALCMAFFARSEESRQIHSVHKLALGALALEDALLKGLPVQKEIEALHKYLEGIDRDSLIDLVLSSLPEEARHSGTDTLLQLNLKFDALKGMLRHFSLIPPGGGGILTHVLAHVASLVKVKDACESEGGVESVISRVENYLAEGKLVQAADALEEGLKGTQAAEVVADWVTRARNRAITEQALTVLQSYATSISLI